MAAADGISLDWMVSVDDHVLEPPDVWRRPDAGEVPRRRPAPGRPTTTASSGPTRTAACRPAASPRRAGKPRDDVLHAGHDRLRRHAARLLRRVGPRADMDTGGILASLCFPSFPRFCGQIFCEAKDKELALLCVQAYNDWMVEEWCASAPGRFIPLDHRAAVGSDAAAARSSATPRGASPPWRSRRTPSRSACRRSTTSGATGTRCSRAAEARGWSCACTSGSSSTLPAICHDAPTLANISFGDDAHVGHDAVVAVQRHVRALPAPQDRLSEGQHRLDPVLPRARRAVRRQAEALASPRGVAGPRLRHGATRARPPTCSPSTSAGCRHHVYGCFIEETAGLRCSTSSARTT